MSKDIRIVKPNQGMKRQSPKTGGVQAQFVKGLDKISKQISTNKKHEIKKEATNAVSKEETPKQWAPSIFETWIEKKASSQDMKKRRCVVTLVLGQGQQGLVYTVSKVAYDKGDMCPVFVQELTAFMKTWQRMK